MNKKRILCFTGTRADYFRVRPVLKELVASGRITLNLAVGGQHLLANRGNTIECIKADGFEIHHIVPMYTNEGGTTPESMAYAYAKCCAGFVDVLINSAPDLVLLTVDRVETLATASVAALMNFPIAHIQGGEETGTIDESIRHAVTKLSHYHFPANQRARDLIIRLGESPNRVFDFGCPYVDELLTTPMLDTVTLAHELKIPLKKGYIVCVFHPVTTEYECVEAQFSNLIEAVSATARQCIFFKSNMDAGSDRIDQMLKKCDSVVLDNVQPKVFFSLLTNAAYLIGNSSAGIREAPYLGTVAINVGTRQANRLRDTNVIDCENDLQSIRAAIAIAESPQFKLSVKNNFIYGSKGASKKIADKLIELSAYNDIEKQFNWTQSV